VAKIHEIQRDCTKGEISKTVIDQTLTVEV